MGIEKLDLARLNEYGITVNSTYNKSNHCYWFSFKAPTTISFGEFGNYESNEAYLIKVDRDSDNPFLLLGQGDRQSLPITVEGNHYSGNTPCLNIDRTYVTMLYVKESSPFIELYVPLSLFISNK
ncbi:hypothetical protein NBRC116492_24860 [Aurantivibrio infirmus]